MNAATIQQQPLGKHFAVCLVLLSYVFKSWALCLMYVPFEMQHLVKLSIVYFVAVLFEMSCFFCCFFYCKWILMP